MKQFSVLLVAVCLMGVATSESQAQVVSYGSWGPSGGVSVSVGQGWGGGYYYPVQVYRPYYGGYYHPGYYYPGYYHPGYYHRGHYRGGWGGYYRPGWRW